MSLNIDPSLDVPIRPAATVMLIRDAPTLQVCMLQRNLNSDFVGGAYVFPGGGVDPEDGEADVASICDGLRDDEASRALGLPRNGLAFWVAAVRETFEEAGLMMATRGDGSALDFADRDLAERFLQHRAAVDHRERRLVEVCRAEGLRLSLGDMHYVGHWVTPPGAPRRYDTRFFLAAAPVGQRAVQDDREVISAQWIEPMAALDANARGEYAMLPPTIAHLRMLSHFDDVPSALSGAAALGEIPAMVPRVYSDADGIRIVMPGDPVYDRAYAGDSTLRAWPGLDGATGGSVEVGQPVGTVPIGMPDIDGVGQPDHGP